MKFDSTATLASSLDQITLDSPYTIGTCTPIIPDFEVPSLPPKVTIGQVYRVFLAYLLEQAKAWWIERKDGGVAVWERLYDSAEIIMAIPDGWNETQQATLRRALVEGELCSAEGAELRLTFVREAEASVHYAMTSLKTRSWLNVSTCPPDERRKSSYLWLPAARLGFHPRRSWRLYGRHLHVWAAFSIPRLISCT